MNPTCTAVRSHVKPGENCNFEIQVLLMQESGLKGLERFTSVKKVEGQSWSLCRLWIMKGTASDFPMQFYPP